MHSVLDASMKGNWFDQTLYGGYLLDSRLGMGPGLHFLYSSLVLALRKKKCLRKAVQRVYALHSLKVYKAGKTACLTCSPVGSRSELDSFAQTQQLSAKRHLRHKDVDLRAHL